MRKSIESGKHTQIKLPFIFYEAIHDKRHLGILVFYNIIQRIAYRVIWFYAILIQLMMLQVMLHFYGLKFKQKTRIGHFIEYPGKAIVAIVTATSFFAHYDPSFTVFHHSYKIGRGR